MLWWVPVIIPILGLVWLCGGSVEIAIAVLLVPYAIFVAIDDDWFRLRAWMGQPPHTDPAHHVRSSEW